MLKSSNVKWRFGYALNFFRRELNSSDVFFQFLQYYLHCVLLAQPQYFKNFMLSIYRWLTFFFGLGLSLE